MSEQVQCMSAKEWAERAPTRRMVLEDDYDTLHAEAEALRAENGRLKRTVEEGMPRLMQQGYELRTQLEAARGLLREMDEYLSRRGDGEAIHTGSKFHMAIDAFLTATPAPEVPAEQGERQEVVAVCMGCVDQASRIRELEHKMDYYATPQPGPDVRGLVEALEHYADCGKSGNVARVAITAWRKNHDS